MMFDKMVRDDAEALCHRYNMELVVLETEAEIEWLNLLKPYIVGKCIL
jgi:hypothetical protein